MSLKISLLCFTNCQAHNPAPTEHQSWGEDSWAYQRPSHEEGEELQDFDYEQWVEDAASRVQPRRKKTHSQELPPLALGGYRTPEPVMRQSRDRRDRRLTGDQRAAGERRSISDQRSSPAGGTPLDRYRRRSNNGRRTSTSRGSRSRGSSPRDSSEQSGSSDSEVAHQVKVHTVKQAPPDEPQALRQRIRARSLAMDADEVNLPPAMDIQRGRHTSWAGKVEGQMSRGLITNPEGGRLSQETESAYRRGRGSLDQSDRASQARYVVSEQEGMDRPRRRRSTASRLGPPKIAIMPTGGEEGLGVNASGNGEGHRLDAIGREVQRVMPSPDRAARGARRSLQIAPAGEEEVSEDYLL